MNLITLFFLSVGLAMDAFAVSITNGLCYKETAKSKAIVSAFSFGVAQGIMPVIGYFFGSIFAELVSAIDHWLVLIILGFLGINMVIEAVKEMKNPEKDSMPLREFTYKIMFSQAIATSIDALSVGVGFAAINVNILYAGLMIGIITFICCTFGVRIGEKFGSLFKEKAEIFGGCVLVFIGVKIFLEHTIL